jgi:hypothetical protein
MDHAISDIKLHRWPLEVRVMTLDRTGCLRSIIGAMKRNGARSQELDDLLDNVREYEELFPSFDNMGTSFGDRIAWLSEGDGHLGRSDIYPRILGEMYGCPERYGSLEERILIELYRELPGLKRASYRVKEKYGTTMDSEDILNTIASERSVSTEDIVPIIDRLREKVAFWGMRRIIDYPQERDIGIIETPEYLRPVLGNGGCVVLNGLKGRPMSDLFITTVRSDRRSLSFSELFQFVIGEELGYRANYLNSLLRPKGSRRTIELMPGPFMDTILYGSMSNHQIEVAGLMRDLIEKGRALRSDEKELVEYLDGIHPLKELVPELEFLISRQRTLDLLSGVADIRLNTGTHSIAEFIRWANILTGMEKDILTETIHGPMMFPGRYAVRQMISMERREISRKMRKKGVSIKDFNTISTRFGFSPWKFQRERILKI